LEQAMAGEVVGKNKVVYMTFSILDEEGRVMGQQDMPTGYVHGAGSGLFEEIEAALEGHAEGDEVEASLSPEKAFGPSDPNLIIVEDLDNVPPQIRYVGAEAELQNDKGDVLTFRVVAIADGKITLDGNHPLAGKHARCMAKVVSVRTATAEEVSSGFPAEQGAPKLQ
jgi:FKBP-type peptidyl-prolyl cis-trans isomerase SlyD